VPSVRRLPPPAPLARGPGTGRLPRPRRRSRRPRGSRPRLPRPGGCHRRILQRVIRPARGRSDRCVAARCQDPACSSDSHHLARHLSRSPGGA
jgi:hypothetical protein